MRKIELLHLFNNLIKEKNLPYKSFSSWNEIHSLETETLQSIFDSFMDFFMIEGLGSDSEPNEIGLVYEEISDAINEELMKRKDSERKC